MSRLELRAPLSGWLLPLAQVCDEVFAGGLAGDGVAIDPTDGVLCAPCDGVVVLPGKAKHAVSVRHESGIEILMHVGIDTVALQGRGFEVLVAVGQRVRAGDLLLRFDLDVIARGAKSAVTPVLVTGGGHVIRRAAERLVRAGDLIVEVEAGDSTGSPRTVAEGSQGSAGDAGAVGGELAPLSAPTSVRGELVEPHSIAAHFRIPFDHGLHARPAAQIVAALRGLDAAVELQAHGRRADARSAVAMMSLGVQLGDLVEAKARGAQAAEALRALGALLSPVQDVAPSRPRGIPPHLEGLVAAPGLAIGTSVALHAPELPVEQQGRGEQAERHALEAARARVADHLRGAAGSDLAAAHLAILDDPELARLAQMSLHAGKSAAFAWRCATRSLAARLSDLHDARMRERAADLRDLEAQVLRVLAGGDPADGRVLPDNAILFADELLPSQFAALDATRIAGIVMARGGPTSHVALLAAARGIPTLVASGPDALAVPEGRIVLIDTAQRRAAIDPPPAQLAAARERLAQRTAREAADRAACMRAAVTRDGQRIAVQANIGAVAEIGSALALGAEGCGLLRTEFLFLERHAAPDEEEQYETYAAAARAFAGRSLTIRTLDVGGDKPLAYLPLPREENPALGVRGLRVGLREPALLRTQLRAILRAAAHGPLRAMLPMVNDPTELRAVRAIWHDAANDLGLRDLPPLGIMIETPSSALLAPALARDAEFFSIGSNDLSQYVLAMDRGHDGLAGALDALHPAVLQAIRAVVDAARAAGRSVSLCGGLASDGEALPILLGLGLRELSAVPARIPELKRRVRGLELAACEALAQRALGCDDASQVRALVHATTRDEPARAAEATP